MADTDVMLDHLSIQVQKVLRRGNGKSNLTHVCEIGGWKGLSRTGFTLSSTNLSDVLFSCHTIWPFGFSNHFLLLSIFDDHQAFSSPGLQRWRAIHYAENVQKNSAFEPSVCSLLLKLMDLPHLDGVN